MPPPTDTTSQPPANHAAAAAREILAPLDLEALRPVLHQLADLIADRVAQRLAPTQAIAAEPPSGRLLTLDQLVALLPRGKNLATWKGWLYQRTRIAGEVPGQYKVGGRLFFDPEQTLPWLLNHATGGTHRIGLDVAAEQSLHARAMAHEPGQARQRGRQG